MLTAEQMLEFPRPRKIGCSEPSEDGEMRDPTHPDVSCVQYRGGVSRTASQHNGSFASPKKKYDGARLQTSC